MVAFNWSHARAGRAETQLELCQAGPLSQARGWYNVEDQGEATNRLQTVLCFMSAGRWSPIPPPSPPERERTTNRLFVSNIETFSVMRMTCFQIKTVKRRVFCWWNNVVNIMETIRHRVIPRQVE